MRQSCRPSGLVKFADGSGGLRRPANFWSALRACSSARKPYQTSPRYQDTSDLFGAFKGPRGKCWAVYYARLMAIGLLNLVVPSLCFSTRTKRASSPAFASPWVTSASPGSVEVKL